MLNVQKQVLEFVNIIQRPNHATIKRNKRFHAEVHASSMSDIMFFLLLFFDYFHVGQPNVIKMTLPKSKVNEK